MKKHLFGFAIFVSIVSAAILVYGYFNVPPIPVIPAINSGPENGRHECDTREAKISNKVLAAAYDVRSGLLIADVELKWTGRASMPKKLHYNVMLIDENGPENWIIQSTVVERPFELSNTIVQRMQFAPADVAKLSDLDNIYVHVETSETGTFLLKPHERREPSVVLPVLKIHK